jgi:GTP-binding protein LepA
MTPIRNFCIIAHIDHGKSTLADRLLEITNTVNKREMKEQLLDSMDLERERGITIKLQPATMNYSTGGIEYQLNLIDTPGHVDFSYEVSRSLAAVEGALLLVDATQGIQAQTLANLYLAIDQNLEIIPVINKIDLPNAHVDEVCSEIISLLGCKKEEIIPISAKTGEGVKNILDEIVKRIPAPATLSDKPARALIFDSFFDKYRGVVAEVRVVEGCLKKGERIKFMASKADSEILEIGHYTPKMVAGTELSSGDLGYIVTGLKAVGECRVGDTITNVLKGDIKIEPLAGYAEAKPMVYAGLFCKESDDYPTLRESIDKLKLNDAALSYEPENSPALGFGFRCGFLGMLHMDIVQERLNREYGLDLIITAPSVSYKVTKNNREVIQIKSPQDLPEPTHIDFIEEPIMKVDIVTPKDYIGAIMELAQEKRGDYINTEFIDDKIAILHYYIPLANLIIDFYDKLKSKSSGYASLNYEFSRWQKADVVKMDILVAQEISDALSVIIYKEDAHKFGKKIVKDLKDLLPKQMFEVKLQAAIGAQIIASERISPMRKDVTAKLYGGDFSRKRKLLEKQKAGKKKMKSFGRVDIPPEAFMAVLKR